MILYYIILYYIMYWIIAAARASNVNLPLQLAPGARSSRLFQKAPEEVLEALQFKDVTFNSHHRGVSPARCSESHSQYLNIYNIYDIYYIIYILYYIYYILYI